MCAGHDPTGRAGVDADAEAVQAAGAQAETVVTTDTQQEGTRVLEISPRAEPEWEALASEALRRGVRAVKFGLLARAEAVWAASRIARAFGTSPAGAGSAGSGDPSSWVVVDPVLVATGGERFLDEAGVEVLRGELIPAGVVLTPNLPELAELAGVRLSGLATDEEARIAAAGRLLELGARAVCVKGGHGGEDPLVDLVVRPGAVHSAARPRLAGPGIRGSGCRFASFLAARGAAGDSLEEASARAGKWVASRIEAGS